MPSQSWKPVRGRLEAFSTGESFAIADQEFFGDLKIEFTVKGLNGSNNDFNAFLFGPTPEDAFRFSLGEWGSSLANIEHGKGSRFAFREVARRHGDFAIVACAAMKTEAGVRLAVAWRSGSPMTTKSTTCRRIRCVAARTTSGVIVDSARSVIQTTSARRR